MAIDFKTSARFSVSPERIYSAWLDAKEHEAMTGGEASGTAEVGASFTAWGGYISGENLELVPESKIVQSWRTAEFADEDEDSQIEIALTPTDEGCELTLAHSNIPDNQPDYNQGWDDHYFTPMKAYFG